MLKSRESLRLGVSLGYNWELVSENVKRKTPGRLAEPALELDMRLFC